MLHLPVSLDCSLSARVLRTCTPGTLKYTYMYPGYGKYTKMYPGNLTLNQSLSTIFCNNYLYTNMSIFCRMASILSEHILKKHVDAVFFEEKCV